MTVGFLLLDVIPVLLIAMPMTLIIITGEIDLSVASIAGLTSATHRRALAGRVDIGVVLVLGLVIGVLGRRVQRLPRRRRRTTVARSDDRHPRAVPRTRARRHRRQRRRELPARTHGVLHLEDRRDRHPHRHDRRRARRGRLRRDPALHPIRSWPLRPWVQHRGGEIRGHPRGPIEVLALRRIRWRFGARRHLLDTPLLERHAPTTRAGSSSR